MEQNLVYCVLADQGHSEWTIVVGEEASPSEKYAAGQLQYFLNEIGQAVLPIVSDAQPRKAFEIWIGFHQRQGADAANEALLQELGEEGFVIRTAEDHIEIAGGRLRGTLYGVYEFLERELGCRWYSAKVSRIPTRSRIEIGFIADKQIPVLEYREPYFDDIEDGDWSARNKCNGQFSTLQQHHGGKINYLKPWVHSFDFLVPVDKYYAEHPEYFSEVNGVRLSKMTQICLSNPGVFEVVLEGIKKWIADNPACNIVSISQNDWQNQCECVDCRAVLEQEGTYSGGLIRFVNRISDALEADYPHMLVDTLAYQYTRTPPKVVKPKPNVIVRLCNIECCFSHPHEACDKKVLFNIKGTDAPFIEDLQAWAAICDRLYIWDYVANFANYILPFPNLFVMKPNIELFVRNNVKGVFSLGSYWNGGGGEFAELRSYMLAKLMWNPAADDSLLIDEFLAGYYGRGGFHLRRYIDALHRKVVEEDIHVGIYERADAPYLTDELLKLADACFDAAEQLAEDDQVLGRLRIARLPIRFAKLVKQPTGAEGRDALLDQLGADIKGMGMRQMMEHIEVDETIDDTKRGVIFTHFAQYEGGWSPIKEHNEH